MTKISNHLGVWDPWLRIKLCNKWEAAFHHCCLWNPLLYQSLHNNILFSLLIQFQSSFCRHQWDWCEEQCPMLGLAQDLLALVHDLIRSWPAIPSEFHWPSLLKTQHNLDWLEPLGFDICYSWYPSHAPHFMHWPWSKHCREMVNEKLYYIPFIATQNWEIPESGKIFKGPINKSILLLLLECSRRRTQENPGDVIQSSSRLQSTGTYNTCILEQLCEQLCQQHEWEQENHQGRRRLPLDFF